jgi:hypothetical protein
MHMASMVGKFLTKQAEVNFLPHLLIQPVDTARILERLVLGQLGSGRPNISDWSVAWHVDVGRGIG